VLGPVLIVVIIIIGQVPAPGPCASPNCTGDPLVSAFQGAARRVLGNEARLDFEVVAGDPPDQEAIARATAVDGVVELSFSATDNRARVHCYVAKEQRWVDREISFGESHARPQIELVERGRLLGFAVASLFSGKPQPEPTSPAPAPEPIAKKPLPSESAATRPPVPPEPGQAERLGEGERVSRRSIEFAGIASSGLHGTAAGLGASAALRLGWTGPLWARVFVAGRTGNIPKAQSSTRTAQLGAGLALALLPATHRFELGVRVDVFASYFDASHLSEDDIAPDRRSRWLPGGDLIVEGGVRISGGAGLLLAGGLEGLAGKTEIYTHGNRVAVVPPFRAVAELGFRTRF
jgi:hypothetical protein